MLVGTISYICDSSSFWCSQYPPLHLSLVISLTQSALIPPTVRQVWARAWVAQKRPWGGEVGICTSMNSGTKPLMDLVRACQLGRRADWALPWGSVGFLLSREHRSRGLGPPTLVSDSSCWLEPGTPRGGALGDLGVAVEARSSPGVCRLRSDLRTERCPTQSSF